MNNKLSGNLLLVSNYPSDTKYAWWLMEHFWKTQAMIFQEAGLKTFLAYPEINSVSKTIKNSPICPIELCVPWHSKKQMMEARSFFRDNNIHYIYFTDQPYLCPKYVSMRIDGVRRIMVHDHAPGDRPPVMGVKGAIKYMVHCLPWVTADKVICISKLMLHRNVTNGRIPKSKCAVVQNGIRPVECTESHSKKMILRKALDISQESVLILTTGRAHPYKRLDFVIQCANKFRNIAPDSDVSFLLVGDGPAMPELKKLVKHLKLEKMVRLLGFRNDVHDLACMSDLAFHAALGEGFSLSIIEYMSAGLPVLVPNIPSVSQAITHGETGFIYSKDDMENAASQILCLVTDSQLRIKMGKTAKEQANTRYNLEQCTQSFIVETMNTYHMT